MKLKKQKGFTLIELMIVVAIVAILAAVALPFYADFTFRSKMSEVAASIDACKVAVTDYHETYDSWPANEDIAGCDTTTTQYTTNLAVAQATGGGAEITVDGAGDVADCNLRLTSNDTGGTWTGAHDGSECEGSLGKVPPRFRDGTF